MLPLLPLLLMTSPWLLHTQSVSASATTPAAATGGSDLLTLLLAEAHEPATRDFMLACRWGRLRPWASHACMQAVRPTAPRQLRMHAGD